MALQNKYVLPPPPNPDDDVNGYSWRDWFRQLRDYIVNKGTILWSQIDFTGSNITDIVRRSHQDLQNLQGGNLLLNEYYHLSNVQYTDLTDGGNTTLHYHDSDRDLANATGTLVIKTTNFTVAVGEYWLINNKSGSTCTVTLPTASSYIGRELHFQNYQNYTVVSASSNVVPIGGGSATTAILADIAGDTCTLVSDGTNWVMTQYIPNNVLLI